MKRPLYGLYGAQICQHTLNCTAKRVAACPCDVTHLEHAVSQEAVASRIVIVTDQYLEHFLVLAHPQWCSHTLV